MIIKLKTYLMNTHSMIGVDGTIIIGINRSLDPQNGGDHQKRNSMKTRHL